MATSPVNQISVDVDVDDASIGTITSSGQFSPSGTYSGGYSLGHSGTYTLSPSAGIGSISMRDPISSNPKLPETVFYTHCDAGNPVKLTLVPEYSISHWEVLQLMLLIHSSTTNPAAFGVFQFVAKNNLERHFKYTR